MSVATAAHAVVSTNVEHIPTSKLPAIFEACGARNRQELKAALDKLTDDELDATYRCWPLMAMPYQLPPPSFASGHVRNWMLIGARGVGKNVASSNWLCEQAEQESVEPHLFGAWMAFVGVSYVEAEKAMLDPDAGLVAISHRRGFPCEYDLRKRCAIWPNGVKLYVYGSYEAATLRGKNLSKVVLDEWMFWPRNGRELAQVVMATVRSGKCPQIVWTCNPNWETEDDWAEHLCFELPDTVRTHVQMRDNVYLPESYIRQMETSLGSGPRYRSEVLGLFSSVREGALSSPAIVERNRIKAMPAEFDRVVVCVDPASSVDANVDEHGIMVVGLWAGVAYVLEDASGHYGVVDGEWARVVASVHDRWSSRPNVQRIDVGAEINSGWGHVVAGIRVASPHIRVIKITASQGKQLRAEPVAALIEAGSVKFVGNYHALENELVSWVPSMKKKSPNRLDALVHAVTELMLTEDAAKKRVGTTLDSYI